MTRRRLRRVPLVRLASAVLAGGLALTLSGVAAGSAGAVAAHADSTAPAGSSALTVSGTGQFASLKVTASQTSGLIDQVINVSWTGGTPTDDATSFRDNYLQIMQCWGDDPGGPQREQCEFGSFTGDPRGPERQPTRQVCCDSEVVDPLETYVATPDNANAEVPFESATGTTVPGADIGQFFDQQSTNEIPFARTQPDGTGQAFFETLTSEEAPGLGCGAPDTDAATGVTGPRNCWLVIVPRGATEVDGQPVSATVTKSLVTSPLSASNWANRIVIPLHFQPDAVNCPLGSPEAPTGGQEVVQEAVARWQPALCNQTGTIYGYSAVSDQSARSRLVTSSPGLDFVTTPVPPAQVPPGTGLLYAPVTLSGAVIAFNVDVRTNGGGTDAQNAALGQRITSLNLTPRVVAKLITQSYQAAAPPFDPAVASNPANLFDDPDFLVDNPTDKGMFETAGDVLMPFPLSDVTAELWSWINADPDARAFLDGTPDPWGMTVNPSYKGVTDASIPDDFPKSDPYCQKTGFSTVQPPLCTLDDRPYAENLHDAARSAARGDTLSRALFDSTALPPAYKKVAPQVTGNESVLAFTDAATAARYSLPVASLRNAAGQFVAPTSDALLAGVVAMVPSAVPGVLTADPSSTSATAYPLTTVTYAATSPQSLDAADRASYATFLHYAVTTGQQPGLAVGELPFGYVPLPADLVAQTLTAATELQNNTFPVPKIPPSATPAVTPTTTPAPKTTVPATKTKSPTKPTAKNSKPVVTPPATPTPTGSPSLVGLPLGPPPDEHPPGDNTVPAILPTSAAVAPTQTPPPDGAAPTSSTPATSSPAPVASTAAAAASAAPIQDVAVATARVPVGAGRYIVLIVFAVGALCALGGPAMVRLGGRRKP